MSSSPTKHPTSASSPLTALPLSPKRHPTSTGLTLLLWRIKKILVPAAILILAAMVRFWSLEIKPPHFDEGVNGWFADQIRSQGFFRYNPENYHGPLHFYALFLTQTLLGRSVFALRLPAVLASVAAVAAILAFSQWLGKAAAYWAALAMALSPAFVFYARYSIHESWLVFFNILFVLGAIGIYRLGKKRDLWIFLSGLAGMILTKETYIIHLGSFLLAIPPLLFWNRIISPRSPVPKPVRPKWTSREFFAAIAMFALVIVFFYSGNFYCWESLHGLWKTHALWAKTGVESAGHAKPAYDLFGGPLNWYWIALMLRYEWPALFGLAACFWCLGCVHPILRLLAIYASGLLLAYSLISYKTPWCIISFLWPFHLLAGSFVASFRRLPSREIAAALLAVAIGFSAHRMLLLNFQDYDNEREPYVYVQTYRDINRFLQPILNAVKKNPALGGMRGEILLGSYYPLPWILGDFWNLAWFGDKNWPSELQGDFVVGDVSKRAEILSRLRGNYRELQFRFRDAQEPSVAFFREETFPELLSELPSATPSTSQPEIPRAQIQ